uniref:Uncharacterized protein n=1 Tax=Tanacetum cinerariifolium TaxID=118510 RepID=A0A6L2NH06_TANCI|nr:hypothetical protein [Tanacetum cinerariifolium]
MQEGDVDRGKALDADSAIIKSSGIELENHDISSRSWNDTHAKNGYIKPVNDKAPMAEGLKPGVVAKLLGVVAKGGDGGGRVVSWW